MTVKRTASDREVMDPVPPARGRKRFLFDIQKAEKVAEQGVEVKGLRLLGTSLVPVLGYALTVSRSPTIGVARGEEDGSFDCTIIRIDGEIVASLTFLVSGE